MEKTDLLNKLRGDDYWNEYLLDSLDDLSIRQLLIGSIANYANMLNLRFSISDERDDTIHILIFKKDSLGGNFVTGANGEIIWCINEVYADLKKNEISLVAEQL